MGKAGTTDTRTVTLGAVLFRLLIFPVFIPPTSPRKHNQGPSLGRPCHPFSAATTPAPGAEADGEQGAVKRCAGPHGSPGLAGAGVCGSRVVAVLGLELHCFSDRFSAAWSSHSVFTQGSFCHGTAKVPGTPSLVVASPSTDVPSCASVRSGFSPVREQMCPRLQNVGGHVHSCATCHS